MLGVSVEAIRQGCMSEYLPVYLDADGLKAIPEPPMGTVDEPVRVTRHQRGDLWVLIDEHGVERLSSPAFTLPQFWRVWNDAATESVDGGLAEACRDVSIARPIAFLETSDRDLAWFPAQRASLLQSRRVRFLDLFVFAEDVAPKDRERARAGKASGASRAQRADAACAWIEAVLPVANSKRHLGIAEVARAIKREAQRQSPQTDATEWLATCSERSIINYINAIETKTLK